MSKRKPNGLAQALEVNALGLLRAEGTSGKAMRERLSARAWLLNHGWTVAEINKAASGEEVK